MYTTASRLLRRSLVIVGGVGLLAGCADDTTIGNDAQSTITARFAGPSASLSTNAATTADMSRAVDLAGCDQLDVPEGSTLTFHAYAKGLQIYRWNGTSWVLVAPDAKLYADEGGHSLVGTHFAGPTWRSVSGSSVVGAVLQRCTPNPDAIAWLKLGAVSNDGAGIFQETDFIQRLNTQGGKAPVDAGSFVGETVNVPYTAEYYFYQVP